MSETDRRTLLRAALRGCGGLAAVCAGGWGIGPGGAGRAFAQTRFSPEANIIFFTIATGPPGGTNFPIGVALATAVSSPPGTPPCDEGGACGVPNLVATAMTTAGSVVNVKGVVAGSFNSGMAQADVIFRAYHGSGFDFEGAPLTDLRVVANLFPQFVHVVVRADSTAKGIADLRDRRIAVEALGSGTRRDAELILAAYGLRPTPDQVMAVPQGDLAGLLTEQRVDALVLIAGIPVPTVMNLAGRQAIRFLPIDGPEARTLTTQHRFFTTDTIPGGTYPGQNPLRTLSVGAQWVVSARAPEEQIFLLTQALWNPANRGLLTSGHASGQFIRLRTALRGIAIPLHPGAQRFYRDAGLLPS
ncbi:TAXI family TRAP transporter solute-binding subunit [Marinibaculum pumilum]|uniref:TAXI family TRAP transporter solute-binding subunit n=1 Tax=Marinibaculum pumilum TaxID=1766165 RepID=A0ABV7L6X8_9PROT